MSTPKRCPAGEQVIAWLDRHKRTQTWLAEQLGVANAVLWRWIAGERTPRIEKCFEIERITGVPARSWVRERPQGKAA